LFVNVEVVHTARRICLILSGVSRAAVSQMALSIIEFFGYDAADVSREAADARAGRRCPFIQSSCTKMFRDGQLSGVCTIKPSTSEPVICCPNRLYADEYAVLRDVANSAFGRELRLVSATQLLQRQQVESCVVVFGKRWGKELRLPTRGRRGSYSVDWVLALIDAEGQLEQFVAVEIQSIDTTGTYRPEWNARMNGEVDPSPSKAGLNWENVSKRILPQLIYLIYKGHVLRLEPLCRKGLFFVCPRQVFERINERLGGALRPYPVSAGALTFRWYDLGQEPAMGSHRTLAFGGEFTTTVDQVVNAFSSPTNLPPAQSYEQAIRRELGL
jgi:hypothetical protein